MHLMRKRILYKSRLVTYTRSEDSSLNTSNASLWQDVNYHLYLLLQTNTTLKIFIKHDHTM